MKPSFVLYVMALFNRFPSSLWISATNRKIKFYENFFHALLYSILGVSNHWNGIKTGQEWNDTD